jgi:4-methyl-5(b-hydroxyethyl)-thiazole monophosphate biosynthesis
LFGKKATTYHLLNGLRQQELSEYEGITVINEPVVIDGNIITSYCLQTAVHVAFSLLEMITSKQLRIEIEELMGYGEE